MQNKAFNKKTISLSALFLAFAFVFAACGAQEQRKSSTDYKNSDNWAYFNTDKTKSADVFFVCPTVDMGEDGGYNMELDNAKLRQNFVGAINMERGIYDCDASFYAPYYRQATFTAYSLDEKTAKPYFDIAYKDIYAAFEYFLKYTKDRPFVLAGFSQGADMCIRLLKDFMKEEKYQKRLVAAYCIGWRITDGELEEYPWLKLAQNETDTGVIVSFNTEKDGVEDSLLVPKGVKTNSINPLNWKTDDTMAQAKENLGACFTDYSGNIKKEVKNLTGAYLSKERGTLIVTDIDENEYSSALFPNGVYHLYDYQFFYRNLQENVSKRINSFKINAQ